MKEKNTVVRTIKYILGILLLSTVILLFLLNKEASPTSDDYSQALDKIKSLSVDSFAIIASNNYEAHLHDATYHDTTLLREVKEMLFALNKEKVYYKYTYADLGIYIAIYKGHSNMITPDFILRDSMLIRKIHEAFNAAYNTK